MEFRRVLFRSGVSEARGEVLCFLSAHGEPADDYVSQSVKLLLSSGAAGVGGVYEHMGPDRRSRAIGLAMSSRFGMASTHRMARSTREVDTDRKSGVEGKRV